MVATDVYLLEGGYAIDILETSIDDGYHHVLAHQTNLVQTMTLQQSDLTVVLAVITSTDTVALLEVVMVGRLDSSRGNRVWRYPYQFAAGDTR